MNDPGAVVGARSGSFRTGAGDGHDTGTIKVASGTELAFHRHQNVVRRVTGCDSLNWPHLGPL